MTIEWDNKWVDVGYVKSRDSIRQTTKVCLEGEDEDKYVTWTDEFLESSEDFKILGDMVQDARVYKKTTVGPFCLECETDAFYDNKSEEYYCPHCEE
jgi:isoleucyl-tRNA synthetase